MLTTASILMSLGMEPANVRQVSSDQADVGGISFAKSFDEGAALTGDIQTTDGGKLKNFIDAESVISAKSSGINIGLVSIKMEADESIANKIQDGSYDAKSVTLSMSVKKDSTSTNTAATAVGGMNPHGKRLNTDTSETIQVEMPDDQIPSGAVKNIDQQLAPDAIEGAKMDATDGAVDFRTDIAASVLPSIPDKGIKLAIQNQKEMLVSDKNQETIATKKATKSHDGVTKTEKAAKTEEKTVKTTVTTGNTVGVESQIAIVVPVLTSVEKMQQGLNTSQEGAVSSVASVASRPNTGTKSVSDGKADKKSEGSGKADGDSTKAVGSASADNLSSQNTETEISKKELPKASSVADDGIAKGQSAGTAVAPTGFTHTGPGVAGVASGGVAGGMAAHIVAPRIQTTDANPHATAARADSDAIDTAGSIDATHKTLIATPTSLEVGVANGTHGWLKIRAEMTGGGVVNASLSAASSSGQDMLRRELPSLTAYLQSERVAVNAVVIQPVVSTSADYRGLTGGMNGDGRGPAQQSGGQQGGNRQDTPNAVLNRTEKNSLYSNLGGVGGDELPSAPYSGGGGWLNVRA